MMDNPSSLVTNLKAFINTCTVASLEYLLLPSKLVLVLIGLRIQVWQDDSVGVCLGQCIQNGGWVSILHCLLVSEAPYFLQHCEDKYA